jgi:hypothetical protein
MKTSSRPRSILQLLTSLMSPSFLAWTSVAKSDAAATITSSTALEDIVAANVSLIQLSKDSGKSTVFIMTATFISNQFQVELGFSLKV